jgi:hypothetical protein
MAMDQFGPGDTPDSISERLRTTNFRRSSLPARKDTITVPSNGYAAVRFRADNPGETPPVHLEKDKTSGWIGACVCVFVCVMCVYVCVVCVCGVCGVCGVCVWCVCVWCVWCVCMCVRCVWCVCGVCVCFVCVVCVSGKCGACVVCVCGVCVCVLYVVFF